MKRKTEIKVVFIALMVVAYFWAIVPTASAFSDDVDVTWIIPGDDTITLSFPTGEGKIEFDVSATSDEGQNFTNIGATSQTGATAALRVTNQGNQALMINGSFNSSYPTGVKRVNVSVDDNSNSTAMGWTNGACTVNATMKASLGSGLSEDFWFWSSGVEVAETDASGVTRTLTIWSKGA